MKIIIKKIKIGRCIRHTNSSIGFDQGTVFAKAGDITGGHSRKKEVFTDVMPQGMPQAIIVSNCYFPYFSVDIKDHQICTANILRELLYLSELYDKHPWSE